MVALKEKTKRFTAGKDIQFWVSYPLNVELQLIEPSIDTSNGLMRLKAFAENMGVTEKDVLAYIKSENLSLYYTFNDLMYVVEHNVKIEGGEVVKNIVSLYLPYDVKPDGSLLCRDVSLYFPPQVRKSIANKNIDFVKERV